MLHLGRVHATHARSVLASALVLVAIVTAGVLAGWIGLTGPASGIHALHAGITGCVLGSSLTLPLEEGVSWGLLLSRSDTGIALHAPVARGILGRITGAGSIPSGSRLVGLGAVVGTGLVAGTRQGSSKCRKR